MNEEIHANVIIVLSGKRKSGKDFVANTIIKNLSSEKCHVMRVAAPIKRHFCDLYKMDYDEMMSESSYKELIRAEMITWGEEQRNKNSGVFCCSEKEQAIKAKKPLWILSDARRPSDVEYFRTFALKHDIQFYSIRISADIKTRESRGWKFTKDVDDVESECGLDGYNGWSYIFRNSIGDDIVSKVNVLCNELKLSIS